MIPDNLYFTEEHEWLRIIDNEFAVIGITDFAQEQLGDIVFIDFPDVDEQVVAGDEFGSIESVKATSELYCPVSGVIVERNENLSESPELINQSPYDEGWLIKIKLEDLSETHGLMDPEAYAYHVKRTAPDNDDDEMDITGEDELERERD